MAWFRVNDRHNDHTKVERLEELCHGDGMLFWAARGVWEGMGVDCAARETDGKFTRMRAVKVLSQLTTEQRDKIAGVLIEAGLWDEKRYGEIVFHDWSDYQPTRAELKRVRKDNAARIQKWRNGKGNANGNAVTPPVGNSDSNAVGTPVPSRPLLNDDESAGEPRLPDREVLNANDWPTIDAVKQALLDGSGASRAFLPNAASDLELKLVQVVKEAELSQQNLVAIGRRMAAIQASEVRPDWCKSGRFTIPLLLGGKRDGGMLIALLGETEPAPVPTKPPAEKPAREKFSPPSADLAATARAARIAMTKEGANG